MTRLAVIVHVMDQTTEELAQNVTELESLDKRTAEQDELLQSLLDEIDKR